jgi:hypothetical protein
MSNEVKFLALEVQADRNERDVESRAKRPPPRIASELPGRAKGDHMATEAAELAFAV